MRASPLPCVVDTDAPTDFFGRPRFLAAPSAVVIGLGFAADFFTPVDPDGRPRFLPDETSFVVVAAPTDFFGDDPKGRPRFLLAGSPTFSFS